MKEFTAEEILDPRENIAVQRNVIIGEEEIHIHGFLELVYIADGCGKQTVNGNQYDVRRGALLFINLGQTHAFCSDQPMTYYNILLKPEFMGRELISYENAFSLLSLTAFEEFRNSPESLSPFSSFEGREMLELEAVAAGMHGEFQRKEAGYRTVLRGYCLVLLARLFRRMALPEPGELSPDTMQQNEKRQHSIPPDMLDYIEAHCCEKLTLEQLARKCFYNPSYFSRIFKEFSGKSLTDFIGEKRIERARELLTGTDLTVEEIALRTGYGDRGQFYKQFKAYAGVTPKSYREAGKRQSIL